MLVNLLYIFKYKTNEITIPITLPINPNTS